MSKARRERYPTAAESVRRRRSGGGVLVGAAGGYLETIDKIHTLYADIEDGFENRRCIDDIVMWLGVGRREAEKRKE
jgi:hypothetical protein